MLKKAKCNVGKGLNSIFGGPSGNLGTGFGHGLMKACPQPFKEDQGRWGQRDVDRLSTRVEDDRLFAATYKMMMDSFDDTCYSDFPQEYQPYCKRMYDQGNAIVEMKLHGFEPWEICRKQVCPIGFFEADVRGVAGPGQSIGGTLGASILRSIRL
jgi:hypothetical protein